MRFPVTVTVLVLLAIVIIPVYADEVAPTVIADDTQTGFWTTINEGTGNYTSSVWDNTAYRVSGDNSYKIYIWGGVKRTIGAQHTYTTLQDWSSNKLLIFWFYGAASGMTVSIIVYGSAFPNYYLYTFVDEVIGWQEKRMQLTDFTVNGAPSWTTVGKIHWWFDTVSKTGAGYVAYFDRFVVDIDANTADNNLFAIGLLAVAGAFMFTTVMVKRRI